MRIFFFFLTKQTNVETVIDFLFISYLFVNFQPSKIQVETIGNANANSKKNYFLFWAKNIIGLLKYTPKCHKGH